MVSGFLQKGAVLWKEVLKTPKALERWMRTPELDLRLNNEQGLIHEGLSAVYQHMLSCEHAGQPQAATISLVMSCTVSSGVF